VNGSLRAVTLSAQLGQHRIHFFGKIMTPFLIQPNSQLRKPTGIIRQRLLGSRVYKL
jgi:hypothetical protein